MTLRLTDEEHAALLERSCLDGIYVQEAVQRAIREYISRSEHRDRDSAAAEHIMDAHDDALHQLDLSDVGGPMTEDRHLTTQEAADLLGISRSTFVKLLEDGEIPYERPGRHRRVLLSDVLTYRQRQSERAREALDRMVEISHESGLYELTATPQRTR